MYEAYYRLSGSPFRLNPDPNFFFGSKIHTRALAYLRYGLNQKEGFIVVTGSPGMGKTTLARALLREAVKERLVVSELNTTHLRADDVLRMVAASFGLEFENLPKSTLLKRLETFLMSRHRAGYHALLLVDEAQNLPLDSLEELRMLSNFYTGNHALLQIFLLGQQQFRELLYSPGMEQLRQRVVAACHLEPLDEIESRDYIEYRLGVVGWKKSPAITDSAFGLIYKLTEGVPRRINTFCERLLLFGALEEKNVLDDNCVKIVAKELTTEVSGNTRQAKRLLEEHPIREAKPAPEASKTAKTEPAPERVEPERPKPLPEKEFASHEKARPGSLRIVSNTVTKPIEQPLTAIDTEVEEGPDTNRSGVDPQWLDLVAMAWGFFRTPWAQPHLTDPNTPLPPGVSQLILVALGRLVVPVEFVARSLEKASESQVKEAARNYIKQVLLSPRSDYYRRLGVHRYAMTDDIKRNYQYLFRLFQPDQDDDPAKWNESYTRRINQAYGTLRDSDRRRKYDDYLNGLERRGAPANTVSLGAASSPSAAAAPVLSAQAAEVVLEHLLPPVTGGAADDGFVDIESLPLVANHALIDAVDARAMKAQASPASDEAAKSKKPGVWLWGLLAALAAAGLAAYLLTQSSPRETPMPQEIVRHPIEPSATEGVAVAPPSAEQAPPVESPPQAGEAPSKPAAPVPEPAETVERPVPVVKLRDKEPTAPKPAKEKAAAKVEAVAEPAPPPPIASEPVAPAAVAKAPEPEPVPRVQPEVTAIARVDLDRTVNRLLFLYEGGDLDQFIALFAEDAMTNDRSSKAEIRRDYANLFSSTDMRVLELPDLRWDISGTRAKGTGNFVVTVLKKGGLETRSFRGTMELGVEKQGNALLINRFVYSYEKR